MNRLHLYLLAAALAVVGLGVAGYKVLALDFPLLPNAQSDVWRVELQLHFQADGGPAKLTLKVPSETGDAALVDQAYTGRGYGVTTERIETNRSAVYAIRNARGPQYLYYRAAFDIARPGAGPEEPRPVLRAPALRAGELVAGQALVDAARAQSADARSLAAAIVERLRQPRPGGDAAYVLGPDPTPARLAAVAADLLRLAGTPARVVNGVQLQPERREAQFLHWIEAYDGERWFAVYPFDLSPLARRHLLPWWRGRAPLAVLEGGHGLQRELTVTRSAELSVRRVVARQRALESRLIDFSPFSLPLQSQLLFRTLLVVPLAAFVLVVLRNVVGFKTFGTFMPVLIALAFRQTGLVAGLVFFTIVLAIGLVVRFYLEQLKLLLVPRLAATLTVVVLLIAALTVISHRLGLDVGLSLGLFPIVILTMTIERMNITWEERGPAEALQQAGGSLAVAAICFALIQHQAVRHLLFVFPELLLVVLAVTLLLGRYTGYRLVELRRFRVLAK